MKQLYLSLGMALGYHCSIVNACQYQLDWLRISSQNYWFSQHIAVKGEGNCCVVDRVYQGEMLGHRRQA